MGARTWATEATVKGRLLYLSNSVTKRFYIILIGQYGSSVLLLKQIKNLMV